MSTPAGPPAPARHPDYRFSLANERTLLAWLRTALAGYRRYARNEAAIAADQPLPAGTTAVWVTGLVAVLVVALLVLVVVEVLRG